MSNKKYNYNKQYNKKNEEKNINVENKINEEEIINKEETFNKETTTNKEEFIEEKNIENFNLKTGVVIDCSKLNVRQESNLNSKVIKVIDVNTKLEIKDKVGEWFKIKLNDSTEGFCMSKYIKEEK